MIQFGAQELGPARSCGSRHGLSWRAGGAAVRCAGCSAAGAGETRCRRRAGTSARGPSGRRRRRAGPGGARTGQGGCEGQGAALVLCAPAMPWGRRHRLGSAAPHDGLSVLSAV